ncbi:MAG: Uma2 family endonuclease [Defluviitaleaceae bacterium]|nr:Uma2 family endonuclease [Defluviitaleaceae bacterium]
MELRKEKQRFTYADYCTWGDDIKCELIDGEIYLMSMPTVNHQRISRRLMRKFDEHLDNKRCEVFPPLDVRLNWEKGDDTVVQPDLLVVCDPEKIDDKGCNGAPDLVIEILSPSTAGYDTLKKFAKYHAAGVRELWFVDPETKTALAHIWSNNTHSFTLYNSTDKITVGILPELTIDLKDIFQIQEEENS